MFLFYLFIVLVKSIYQSGIVSYLGDFSNEILNINHLAHKYLILF